MSGELKRCDFCEDDSLLDIVHVPYRNAVRVECICSVKGPVRGTRAEAIAAWNQRAKPVVKALEWEEDAGPHAHAMGYRENADSALGRYWVENHENSGEWRTYFDGVHGDEIIDANDTEDEAKAAAQADFTRRVLACLEGYDD